MKWIKVLDNFPMQKGILRIKIHNQSICLMQHQGKIYAVSSKCPHAGADISQGWCEEGFIICPVHRYKYNLENGRGASGQGDYLKIYPIEIRDDGIYIAVNKAWWNIF